MADQYRDEFCETAGIYRLRNRRNDETDVQRNPEEPARSAWVDSVPQGFHTGEVGEGIHWPVSTAPYRDQGNAGSHLPLSFTAHEQARTRSSSNFPGYAAVDPAALLARMPRNQPLESRLGPLADPYFRQQSARPRLAASNWSEACLSPCGVQAISPWDAANLSSTEQPVVSIGSTSSFSEYCSSSTAAVGSGVWVGGTYVQAHHASFPSQHCGRGWDGGNDNAWATFYPGTRMRCGGDLGWGHDTMANSSLPRPIAGGSGGDERSWNHPEGPALRSNQRYERGGHTFQARYSPYEARPPKPCPSLSGRPARNGGGNGSRWSEAIAAEPDLEEFSLGPGLPPGT